MITIKQKKEFDIEIKQCQFDKDSLIITQCVSKVYLEKNKIQLLIIELQKLENEFLQHNKC